MGRGQHGSTGRAENDSAYSQQKLKNKDTQANVKEGRQNIKPQSHQVRDRDRAPWQGWDMKAEAQQRRLGYTDQARGVRVSEGRQVCLPDCAEKRIHLEALSCLGPQQEHVLWETEDHCQCTLLTGSEPSHSRPRPAPGHALTQLVKVGLSTTGARH